MKPIKAFFMLVELPTKIASVTPFLLALAYSAAVYGSLRWQAVGIFFAAMLTFDMATTAINNFIGYTKAHHQEGYNYEEKNALVVYGMSRTAAKTIIFSLLAIATALGIYLVTLTGWVTLVVGAFCFAIGVLYTFGPLPFASTPYGETISGGLMGFVIPFLTVYAATGGLVAIRFEGGLLLVSLAFVELAGLFVFCVPLMAGIANIMLANNLCDLEEDVANRRHTVVYYLGRKGAMRLFFGFYVAGFLAVLTMLLTGILPLWGVLALVPYLLVWKNCRKFAAHISKRDTFPLALVNFLVTSYPLLLVLL